MSNKQEGKNYPLDEDTLTQCEDAAWKGTQAAVNLAMAFMTDAPLVVQQEQSIEIIQHYADWEKIPSLPAWLRRHLLEENYGLGEMEAMMEKSILCGSCYQKIPKSLYKAYPDHARLQRYLCAACQKRREERS